MDSFKPGKNITVFVSISDRKTRVSQDAQNVCAITIVGTALKHGTITEWRSTIVFQALLVYL